MEGVAAHVAADAVGIHIVAGPADISRVVQGGVNVAGRALLALVGPIIGNLIVVLRLGVMILATRQFIPLVTVARYAVTVLIHAYHDNAGLAAATMRLTVTDKGITLNFKVIGVHIDHRMVKAHNHISAISAQRDHALGPHGVDARDGLPVEGRGHRIDVTADSSPAARQHAIDRLPHPTHGHGVDELPGSRAIFIYSCQPRVIGPHRQGRQNGQTNNQYVSCSFHN